MYFCTCLKVALCNRKNVIDSKWSISNSWALKKASVFYLSILEGYGINSGLYFWDCSFREKCMDFKTKAVIFHDLNWNIDGFIADVILIVK